MKRNAELLRKIADKIESHPELYDQRLYGLLESDKEDYSCGCIAHWAMILSGELPDAYGIPGFNEVELCGLPTDDHEFGSRLFSQDWKPAPGLTVPEALRRLADGASVESVSA